MSISHLTSTAAWQLAGWTMLHSLWLGALVVLVAAMLRWTLRGISPHVRYAVLLAMLAFLALLPVGIATWLVQDQTVVRLVTFVGPHRVQSLGQELTPFHVAESLRDSERGKAPQFSVSERPSYVDSTESQLVHRWSATISMLAAWLPWLWLCGAPLCFALLATGLIGTERLRKKCQHLSAGLIPDRCHRLTRTLGMTRPVAVAICDRLTGPVLVGIVRPVILLPPAALCGWSPEQIEMVLLHELAHIRRYDNLVNLLQRTVEGVLFFHPAVWLLSHWIRLEREACCDHTVVAYTGQPRQYAQLLVTLAEATRGSNPVLASSMSTAMAQPPLAGRIRRILKLEEEKMLVSRRTVGMVAILLLTSLTLVACYQPNRSTAEPGGGGADGIEVVATAEEEQNQVEPVVSQASTDSQPSPHYSIRISVEFPQSLKSGEFQRIVKQLKAQGHQIEFREQGIMTYGGQTVEGFILTWTKPKPPRIVWEEDENGVYCRIIDSTTKPQESPLLEKPYPSSDTPAATSTPFLSLEDQRHADLAYKMLGVELEPLNPEELVRVRVMKFDSGLRVTGSTGYSVLQSDDLLVGLHVWPTGSLQEMGKLLTRGDLAEYVPLKFYAIRKTPGGGGLGLGRGRQVNPGGDRLVTGRITLTLDAPPKRDISTETSKQVLLYDGKTFAQWRNLWQTELKPERRTEAIRAMAAFGRSGHGKEAVETILDVAGQYDFTFVGGDSDENRLKKAIRQAFTSVENPRLSETLWLPALQLRIEENPEKWRMLTYWLLTGLKNADPAVRDLLDSLTQHTDSEIRQAALTALCNSNPDRSDARVIAALKRALVADDDNEVTLALSQLLYRASDSNPLAWKLRLLPEILPILFHTEPWVRQNARWVLKHIQENDAPPVVQQLMQILQDPARSADHIGAVRALSSIGKPHFTGTMMHTICSILFDQKRTDYKNLLISLAAASRKNYSMSSHSPELYARLMQNLDIEEKVGDGAFENLLDQEDQELYLHGFGMGGGGGGGIGGGGGYF